MVFALPESSYSLMKGSEQNPHVHGFIFVKKDKNIQKFLGKCFEEFSTKLRKKRTAYKEFEYTSYWGSEFSKNFLKMSGQPPLLSPWFK